MKRRKQVNRWIKDVLHGWRRIKEKKIQRKVINLKELWIIHDNYIIRQNWLYFNFMNMNKMLLKNYFNQMIGIEIETIDEKKEHLYNKVLVSEFINTLSI